MVSTPSKVEDVDTATTVAKKDQVVLEVNQSKVVSSIIIESNQSITKPTATIVEVNTTISAEKNSSTTSQSSSTTDNNSTVIASSDKNDTKSKEVVSSLKTKINTLFNREKPVEKSTYNFVGDK
jgi:hypothetical protein